MQICLSMNDLFLPPGVKGLKIETFTREKMLTKQMQKMHKAEYTLRVFTCSRLAI